MPPAVLAAAASGAVAGALGAFTSTFIAGSAILTGAAVYAAVTLVGYLLIPKREPVGTARPDVTRTIRSGLSNQRWIVGRARVGGVLAYVLEAGDKELHLLLVLCNAPADGIEKVWVDGDEIGWTARDASSENGDVMPEGLPAVPVEGLKPSGHMSVRPYYNGLTPDAPIYKINNENPKSHQWTDRHQLRGRCLVHVTLTQSDYRNADERVWTKVPEIEFLVRGSRITWPGQLVPKWTNNAAAIRYWWLTKRRQVPTTAIDNESFSKAFAYCEALVDNDLPPEYGENYPPKSPRYMINGVVHSGDDHTATEAEMDFAWAGSVVEYGGRHYFRPGRDDNLGRTIPRIEPSNIISRNSIQPAPALTDRVNAATMRLAQSSAAEWASASVPELEDDEGVARDGTKLSKDLGIRTFVCCPSSAGRLLATTLRRVRAQKRYNITISPGSNLEWLNTIPSDIVFYNDPELGVRNERCVVVSTAVNQDFSLTLSLERQLNGTHADTLILPPLFQNVRVAPSPKPQPPTGVNITATAQATERNTAQFLVNVSWDATPHEIVINITGPESDESALNNIYKQFIAVSGLETDIVVPFFGTYNVEVRHRDRNGVTSDSVTRKILVDPSDLPDIIDINKITVNDDGSITITYDTGNTVTFNRGKGIVSFVRDTRTGEVVITYGDGSVQRFPILDGAAGGVTEWIYRGTSTATRPTQPTTTEAQKMTLDFVPAGWNDNPVSGTYVWVSSRSRAVSTEPYSEFSVPSAFRGPRGFRGRQGLPGLDGAPAPRYWEIAYRAPHPTAAPEGAYITLPKNVREYRWLLCFGRAGDRFSWTASVDTSQLIRTGHFALQSVSGRDAFIRPGINFVSTRPKQVWFNKWRAEWPDTLYVDEIFGVNFQLEDDG